jgi:hypothetical protein
MINPATCPISSSVSVPPFCQSWQLSAEALTSAVEPTVSRVRDTDASHQPPPGTTSTRRGRWTIRRHLQPIPTCSRQVRHGHDSDQTSAPRCPSLRLTVPSACIACSADNTASRRALTALATFDVGNSPRIPNSPAIRARSSATRSASDVGGSSATRPLGSTCSVAMPRSRPTALRCTWPFRSFPTFTYAFDVDARHALSASSGELFTCEKVQRRM